MLHALSLRLEFGRATLPSCGVALPDSFRGRPRLDPARCDQSCHECEQACPTGAIATGPLRLDLGACILCGACEQTCTTGAVVLTNDPRLAVNRREDLVLAGEDLRMATALDVESRRVFGRSLKLRQVSAGGCSGCEAELVATGNAIFDLGRFGVQFVASPRHADGLVITGPVSANMREALLETWRATPSPRLVIAVGACAISGAVFHGSPQALGIPEECPVDLYVAGCPPHPLTVLDGILRLLGKMQ